MAFSRTYNKVKIQNKLSRNLRTQCGIRQGNFRSTLLFSIGLQKVIRDIEINQSGRVFNRTRQFIAYADDAAIIDRRMGALDAVLTKLQAAAVSIGLTINTDKTEYMETKETVIVANIDIALNG
jgi:hypothetical protein